MLVCLGSGGSGKTSLAAALGLRAAQAGYETVVITIDPARRLAHALGLDALWEHEEQLDVSAIGPPGARFSAMMLAQKPAWDRLGAAIPLAFDESPRSGRASEYRTYAARSCWTHPAPCVGATIAYVPIASSRGTARELRQPLMSTI